MSFLSEDIRQKILAEFPKYPTKQEVTLHALHHVQDALRCVPLEAIKEIAEILELVLANQTMLLREWRRVFP